MVEQETSRSVGADRLKKAPTARLTYSVAQSEADAKTKCDRHGNLHEQGRTFKNSTKGIILLIVFTSCLGFLTPEGFDVESGRSLNTKPIEFVASKASVEA